MANNSGSNWASNVKLRARLPLSCTKSSYQLIVSITKYEIRKTTCPSGFASNAPVRRALSVVVR